MAQSVACTNSLGFLPTLALTTSEDTYTFTAVTGQEPGHGIVVQFACDAAWLISDTSGGNFFLVPANTPFNVRAAPGKAYYVKTSTGTGTLRGYHV
jgi:hypothetical protein